MVLSRSSSSISGKRNSSSCGYFCRRKRFLIFLLWSSSIIIFIVLQLRLIKFDNNNSSHHNSKMMMMHHHQSRTGKTHHDRIRTRTRRSEETILFTSILKEEKVRWKRRMNGIIIPNSIPIPNSIETETTADNNERHNKSNNIVEEEEKEKEKEGEKIPKNPPKVPIILLVGGSDGSGTRGMVDILKNEFYVDFIIEDPTTLDVHGQIMYDKKGWPELVLQVFNVTNGSIDYEFNTTTTNTNTLLFSFQKQQDIKKNIIKLLEYIQRRYIMGKERGLKMAVKKAFQDHIMNMNKSNNATTNIANIANSNDRRTILSRTISIPTPIPSITTSNNATNSNNSTTTMNTTSTLTSTIQIPLPYEASKVSYAFKAPVTMLLLPIFTSIIDTIFIENNNINNDNDDVDKSLLYQQYPNVKFIHVVRDGRDVALSSNQSPVNKFYNATYPNDYKVRQALYGHDPEIQYVRAMQLWNDWNIQTRAWSLKNPTKIDYLMIRTEDLIGSKSGNNTKSSRYDVLLALSNFVGSPRSKKELCCLTYKQSKDYGTSGNHVADGGGGSFGGGRGGRGIRWGGGGRGRVGGRGPSMTRERPSFHQNQRKLSDATTTAVSAAATTAGSSKDVTTRYGKWQQVLENKTRLSDYFYKEGAEGLKIFGYHPYTEIQYNNGEKKKKKNVSSTSSSTTTQQEEEEEEEFMCTREIMLTMTC